MLPVALLLCFISYLREFPSRSPWGLIFGGVIQRGRGLRYEFGGLIDEGLLLQILLELPI